VKVFCDSSKDGVCVRRPVGSWSGEAMVGDLLGLCRCRVEADDAVLDFAHAAPR